MAAGILQRDCRLLVSIVRTHLLRLLCAFKPLDIEYLFDDLKLVLLYEQLLDGGAAATIDLRAFGSVCLDYLSGHTGVMIPVQLLLAVRNKFAAVGHLRCLGPPGVFPRVGRWPICFQLSPLKRLILLSKS